MRDVTARHGVPLRRAEQRSAFGPAPLVPFPRLYLWVSCLLRRKQGSDVFVKARGFSAGHKKKPRTCSLGPRFVRPAQAVRVVVRRPLQYNRVEVKRMATETITIQVDGEAARAYKAAPPADQRKMQALLSLWLKDVAMAQPATLQQIMSDLGEKARDRGLTPEILEGLLKET